MNIILRDFPLENDEYDSINTEQQDYYLKESDECYELLDTSGTDSNNYSLKLRLIPIGADLNNYEQYLRQITYYNILNKNKLYQSTALITNSISLIPIIDSFSPTSGTRGFNVTIYGHNFTSASAVTFGGSPAYTYSITGSTIINATVLSGSTGNVVVTNQYGSASIGTFTYLDPRRL
jgi:hypothetical protein